ncbi:dipeptidyl-peptidase 5 precursor, putative [Entamoeba invadens IP1]|uniref:Dipeptidyl-peptidase 5, putative n=2 Tax=Entamoeba invadens TaxID=33085 RepID=A0A0A1UCV2_ENTIV|nr:dipeptidyl-peptidase 5 precursor, putative [Entamoeba invadens IP1]ELP90124.1 dipeptidyl-peptidase 5 precursor, putative [Entamoeba invadens IP1]BAH98107.1 serine protease [Entamoeba invadens]|eukprot:XP_004256895.1 dipeptidyl-peptidase 5 precursor, putative [Entamoeba invadens IP1]
MFQFFLLFLAVLSKPLDADTLVRLRRLSLGCQKNADVYYTRSQWSDVDNLTKRALFKMNLDTNKEVVVRDYAEDSYSNFVCLDSGVYFLHNGYIAKLEDDNSITDLTTDTPISVDTFKMIEVDGKLRGLASMTVFPSMTLEESAAKFEELEKQNYRVYDKLMIRRWDTYWDGQFQHLFTFTQGEDNKFTFTDIMNTVEFDCPARPFGGNEEYDISKDGQKITFSILLENPASSLNNQIYLAQFDAPTEWTVITQNIGFDNQPIFSDDGMTVYYLAMTAPKDESDRAVIYSYDPDHGNVALTDAIDLSFTAPMQLVGTTMYISTSIKGNVNLVKIDLSKASLTIDDVIVLTQDGTAGGFVLSGNTMIYEYNSFTLPQELFKIDVTAFDSKLQITHSNDDLLGDIKFGQYTTVKYTGANNDDIYAFLTYPPDFDATKKYPVILYTHGGPESPWTNDFHYRWNPQVIAGFGYIVFAPNFHGSGSYGDAFLKAIRTQWGGMPYEDLMKGMDALPTLEPSADIDNACAMGASYGGYMMNWINSQNDRFKCIICHDGIMDSEGSYYYMDEMYFLEVEFGAPYYENKQYYTQWNPLNFVANYKTPQLTIHGGSDYRIDVVAGYQQFTTLQRKNIPSKLVVYPEENHWVLRPYNSIDWHAQVQDWLKLYLQA